MRPFQRSIGISLLCLTATLETLPAEPLYTWTFFETGFHAQPVLFFTFTGPSLIPSFNDTFTVWDFQSAFAPTNCGNDLVSGPMFFVSDQLGVEPVGAVADALNAPWHIGDNALTNSFMGSLVNTNSQIQIDLIDIKSSSTPVPEPATGWLGLAALAVLAAFSRLRQSLQRRSMSQVIPKSQ